MEEWGIARGGGAITLSAILRIPDFAGMTVVKGAGMAVVEGAGMVG